MSVYIVLWQITDHLQTMAGRWNYIKSLSKWIVSLSEIVLLVQGDILYLSGDTNVSLKNDFELLSFHPRTRKRSEINMSDIPARGQEVGKWYIHHTGTCFQHWFLNTIHVITEINEASAFEGRMMLISQSAQPFSRNGNCIFPAVAFIHMSEQRCIWNGLK